MPRKVIVLSVLFTLAMICGGCSGSAGVDWGPKGTDYNRKSGPTSRYERHAEEEQSFWHDLNLN